MLEAKVPAAGSNLCLQCYYLMSFDQNMIIDATTGSIARFVNHSCSPNCRMIKWIVSGQPRMALFAGDNPIMTGDELTYDYNFDPFSAKNVQKCLCGSPNCRGVLGPKPKEVKPPKPPKEEAAIKAGKKGATKTSAKAGKRKLGELLDGAEDAEDASQAAKKRKIKTATGAVKAKPTKSKALPKPTGKTSAKAITLKLVSKVAGKGATKKAAKGAAKIVVKSAASTIKRKVSAAAVRGKTGLSKKTAAGFVASKGMKQTKIPFKKSSGTPASRVSASSTSSRSSIMTTIVAAGTDAAKPTPNKRAAGTPKSGTATPTSSTRTRTPSRKVLEGKPGSGAASAKPRAVPQSVYDFPN